MKKDLHALKEKLSQEREILITDLKGVGIVPDSKNPDDWQARPDNDTGTEDADANEAGDRIQSYANNDSLVQTLEQRLREIDHALKNIESNAYGKCEVCEKDIEDDRLNANPAARTCKEHLNTKLGSPEI
jgi:DnaK suppressor protein